MTWWVSRRRPSWAAAVSPPPLPPPPPPPHSPLPPAASSHSLYSPSRPKDILVSPCRVTFGLRAQPNLPARRTPWATLFDQPRQRAARVPGAACRHDDRTLAQPPRPNADSYPSVLRYPLPSLPRRAFALSVLVARERVFRYPRVPLFDRSTILASFDFSRAFFFTCFLCATSILLFDFVLSRYNQMPILNFRNSRYPLYSLPLQPSLLSLFFSFFEFISS